MDAFELTPNRQLTGMAVLWYRCSEVPVAQWIEHRPPKPGAQVQFLSGTLSLNCILSMSRRRGLLGLLGSHRFQAFRSLSCEAQEEEIDNTVYTVANKESCLPIFPLA